MEEERPLGWRAYTEAENAEHREAGFSDEAIAAMERGNVYSPVENAVWSLELGIAIMHAAGRRFGPDFARDVRKLLEQRAKQLEASESAEDRIEAPLVANLVEAIGWERVIARASDSAWNDA